MFQAVTVEERVDEELYQEATATLVELAARGRSLA